MISVDRLAVGFNYLGCLPLLLGIPKLRLKLQHLARQLDNLLVPAQGICRTLCGAMVIPTLNSI